MDLELPNTEQRTDIIKKLYARKKLELEPGIDLESVVWFLYYTDYSLPTVQGIMD